MKKITLIILLLTNLYSLGEKPCTNPFSTINWAFMFDDMLIGSYGDGEGGAICSCSEADGAVANDVGLKIRTTMPVGFIELVSEPFHFPCFEGDTRKGGTAKFKKRGVPEEYRNGHYFQYPVFALLNIGLDQLCVDSEIPIDLPFIGELFPNWYDDFTAALMHPENILYSNPIAQTACLYDCVKSTLGTPSEYLSWCNGCWQGRILGTGRPVTENPVQDDAALAAAILDWNHMSYNMIQTISTPDNMPYVSGGALYSTAKTIACGSSINYFPKLIKNQYFLQISYPTATDDIITLGSSSFNWGNFKQIVSYQDRIFTLWRRKVCCVGVSNLMGD